MKNSGLREKARMSNKPEFCDGKNYIYKTHSGNYLKESAFNSALLGFSHFLKIAWSICHGNKVIEFHTPETSGELSLKIMVNKINY